MNISDGEILLEKQEIDEQMDVIEEFELDK